MTPNWPIPLRVLQDRRRLRARQPGADLLEQLQPFPAQAGFENHEAGGVAARPRKAIDEAGGDGIGADREHDRNRCAVACSNGRTVAGASGER